jgi:hypothetical protein
MKTSILLLTLLSLSAFAETMVFKDITVEERGQGTVEKNCGDTDNWSKTCSMPGPLKKMVVVKTETEYNPEGGSYHQKEVQFPAEKFTPAILKAIKDNNFQVRKAAFEKNFSLDGQIVELKDKESPLVVSQSCSEGVGEGCSKNAQVCENLPENCVSCKEKCLNTVAESRVIKDLKSKTESTKQKSDGAIQH